MFDEFGLPVVAPFFMSDSGSGSLGGESGEGEGSGNGTPGSPDPAAGGGGVDTPAPGGGEGAGEGGEGSSPQPSSSAPSPRAAEDWRDKRIATLTRRLKELAERQNGQQQAQPPTPASGLSQADVDRLADQRAREL